MASSKLDSFAENLFTPDRKTFVDYAVAMEKHNDGSEPFVPLTDDERSYLKRQIVSSDFDLAARVVTRTLAHTLQKSPMMAGCAVVSVIAGRFLVRVAPLIGVVGIAAGAAFAFCAVYPLVVYPFAECVGAIKKRSDLAQEMLNKGKRPPMTIRGFFGGWRSQAG